MTVTTTLGTNIHAAVTAAAAVLLLLPVPASAQSIHLSGMASIFGSGRREAGFEPSFGVRFIPEVQAALTSGRKVNVDTEVSANAFGTVTFPPSQPTETSGDISLYRAWLRLSTSRFEVRAGLQKVSFGTATLLRPLMWFDSLDPRDPLQLTGGVYAVLARYFTKSNAAFSAWTMYGNDTRRGWDLVPPDKDTPEYGGRIQVPFLRGEFGATYHHRKAAIDELVPRLDVAAASAVAPVPEDRFGLDGKWDLGAGLWFEGAFIHQRTPLLPQSYQAALTVGVDYTFGLGNGLTALAEHCFLESSARIYGHGDTLNFSAMLLRYPLGLLDEVSGMVSFDWENRNVQRFATWKRTYDALTFSAIFFWNPKQPLVFPGQAGASSYTGTGFQLLLAYHF